MALPATSLGDATTVPVSLQIELLAKVAAFDRNLPRRAGDRVVTLVLVKSGSDESVRVAAQAMRALQGLPDIAGRPHSEQQLTYTTAEALAADCRARRAAIVYLTPGFDDAELGAISGALGGLDILSAAAVASFVSKGIVLGFDLVSGKSKLVVSLSQANLQGVGLSANVLRLAKVLP